MDPVQCVLFDDLHLGRWLPDESFHSLVSRYHVRLGRPPKQRTSTLLFGNPVWKARHDLPTQLEAFASRTLKSLGDARDIIRDRTIAPLFLPFLSEPAQIELLDSMLRRGVGNPTGKLGLIRQGFASRHPLKACRTCMEEDEKAHGVAWWHRSHQCPGVWICPIHERPLLRAVDTSPTPHDWYLPFDAQWYSTTGEQEHSPLGRSRSEHLASFALGTLQLPWLFRFDIEVLREVLRQGLFERSLATSSGTVRLTQLTTELLAYWAPLVDSGCAIPMGEGNRAAYRLVGKLLNQSKPGLHPLSWLSLIAFLFLDWHSFLAAYENQNRLNPRPLLDSSPDEDAEPPKVQQFKAEMAAGATLASAARGCNISIRIARRWCVQHAIAVERVLAGFPLDKRDKAAALYVEGHSREEIAFRMVVDVSLVTYALDAIPGIDVKRRAAQLDRIRKEHRAALVSCLSAHPRLPRSHLRLHCQAAYSWLLNNDRLWLEQVLPSKAVTASSMEGPEEIPQLPLQL